MQQNSEGYSIGNTGGIRPVVTLKAGVKITGGSGTEGSPYTLSE